MATYSFKEIVDYARLNSPFYREFYKDVNQDEYDITKFPIIVQEKFWEANSVKDNKLITQNFESGIIFKSGGTSGNPKFSYFTNEEWESFSRVSAYGYSHNGIMPGDRMANLFYAGELYASFLYITFTSFFANKGINYPISGATEIPEIVKMIRTLGINVLAGTPTTMMKIAEYIAKNNIDDIKIRLVLFGGESFYNDQRQTLKNIFPDVIISSILYASVDGGELGYSDSSCLQDEHRKFDSTTILEIVNEDNGEVINEQNIPGKILITNLTRKLMPLIRYPAGDRAIWIEPENTPNRKFKLLGRTEEGARIGPCTLYIEDVLKVLDIYQKKFQVVNFQIIIEHFDNKDKGIIHIVSVEKPEKEQEILDMFRNNIYEERHMLIELVNKDIIHPLEVRFIENSELICNNRTGKAKKVIDKRFDK